MASLTSSFFPTSMIFLSLLVMSCERVSGYGRKEEFERANWEENERLLPTTSITGIQGLVYCNSGPEQIPLRGALVRITCVAVHEHEYETAPFSILTDGTDEEGYFFTTFSTSELEDNWQLTHCKAFLESSPMKTCKFPTDINNGVTGSPLLQCRHLSDKNINLCSVEPLFFTSHPQPISNGY
ncbi:hypothetical protein PVL29_008668 [Vitis rotundifolia]|uniref:Proline-rich protein 3 n=1 Tax=Vitis rotundifolia TaxID=103349 RepID=A0AA39DUH4_VITRO|nr:hypothetical protein PVL29_008668 [Vitis rotundifolia]